MKTRRISPSPLPTIWIGGLDALGLTSIYSFMLVSVLDLFFSAAVNFVNGYLNATSNPGLSLNWI